MDVFKLKTSTNGQRSLEHEKTSVLREVEYPRVSVHGSHTVRSRNKACEDVEG